MIKKAIFAGGCFWCMIKPFDKYECGVKSYNGREACGECQRRKSDT